MNIKWEDIPFEGSQIVLREVQTFCLRDPNGGVAQEARFVSPVDGILEFKRTPKGINVKGRIEASVALFCSRCLREYIYPIVSEFNERLIFGRYAPYEEETELVADEMDISFITEEGVELEDIVEEQIWLNIPLKPLCHDDCKGLCEKCGADLNEGECGCNRSAIDSPFLILQDIKSKLTPGRK